jgi:ABC-2 type transport system permease protein
VRALSQAFVVYICAFMLGVRLNLSSDHIAAVVILIALGAGLFSTFSLIIACIVKTRERFMGIGQVLTMPIFFASNAIYPLTLMPGWLKTIAAVNPLTYEVDGLRAMMLENSVSVLGLGIDIIALLAFFSVFVIFATRLYPLLTR